MTSYARIAGPSAAYAIEAELNVPQADAEGVIVANADFIGGFALWVDGDGRLNHTYSFPGCCRIGSPRK